MLSEVVTRSKVDKSNGKQKKDNQWLTKFYTEN